LKKNGSYQSIYQLILFSVLFYFTSGIVILSHKYDLSGYCKDDSHIPEAHTIAKFEDISCRTRTNEEVIHQNFWRWTMATVLGL